jgi:hypothetical protein
VIFLSCFEFVIPAVVSIVTADLNSEFVSLIVVSHERTAALRVICFPHRSSILILLFPIESEFLQVHVPISFLRFWIKKIEVFLC